MNTLDQFEGVLLIDKPKGITSHDVVDRVRRIVKMKRVGHAGTLDPIATGVLIILIGKATKISQFLCNLDKGYEGKFKFGQVTDSHDIEGKILEENPVPEITLEELNQQMKKFSGDQYQTPPMFSAIKIKGQPLYKLARKGKTVEREPRFIHISKFETLNMDLPYVDFRLYCSKGTYVRTVVHDLGNSFSCGAHLVELRRTFVDRFKISDSIELGKLESMSVSQINRCLIPAYQAVPSNVL